MEGWIKIHRKLLDWEWYSDTNTTRLWLHLLLTANRYPQTWKGMVIGKGQMVTTRQKLASETGLSEQQIRTCLGRLKSTNELTITSTSKYTIITICKYDDYQVVDETDQPTDNQQLNQQITTIKERKNLKEKDIDKSISKKKEPPTLQEREQSFYESLIPFVAVYGKDMVRNFYNYWSQTNPNGKKMLWEMQKVFDIKKRLITWSNKETKSSSSTKPKMDMYEESLQKIIRGEKL